MSRGRLSYTTSWDTISWLMGPRDALRYLQKYFPLRFGQTYWDAINACISALLHECDPAHARTCFIAAYAECIVTIDDLWQDITCAKLDRETGVGSLRSNILPELAMKI